MKCANCGAETNRKMKFCGECGSAVVAPIATADRVERFSKQPQFNVSGVYTEITFVTTGGKEVVVTISGDEELKQAVKVCQSGNSVILNVPAVRVDGKLVWAGDNRKYEFDGDEIKVDRVLLDTERRVRVVVGLPMRTSIVLGLVGNSKADTTQVKEMYLSGILSNRSTAISANLISLADFTATNSSHLIVNGRIDGNAVFSVTYSSAVLLVDACNVGLTLSNSGTVIVNNLRGQLQGDVSTSGNLKVGNAGKAAMTLNITTNGSVVIESGSNELLTASAMTNGSLTYGGTVGTGKFVANTNGGISVNRCRVIEKREVSTNGWVQIQSRG